MRPTWNVAASDALCDAVRRRRFAGERLYEIAKRAGVHPHFFSRVVNRSIPLLPDDHKVLAIGRVLGLKPEECFAVDAGPEAV